MWVPALLALLLCAVCFSLCSESPRWEYHFVDQNLTWSEAQEFCRQHYHDLACVSSSEDNLRLPRPPGYSAPVWIGLYDDPADLSQWKWTATNSSASYRNWQQVLEVSIEEPRQCGTMFGSSWSVAKCTKELRGICYSGSSPKVYQKAPKATSWDEALTYCRTHHTDLAFIESKEENDKVASLESMAGDWIGLFRPIGRWSDHRAVNFTAWYEPVPKMWNEPFCAAENENNNWEVFSCQERRAFYCQASKSYKFLKMKFSGHGLDDPAINQQILDEIQKRFEAAGHTGVKIEWKTAPKKQRQEEKKQHGDCLTDM